MKLRRYHRARHWDPSWVQRGAARLLCSHGSPAAALDALDPAMRRVCDRTWALAVSLEERLRKRRDNDRYGYWLDVRYELRARQQELQP